MEFLPGFFHICEENRGALHSKATKYKGWLSKNSVDKCDKNLVFT